MVIKKIDPVSVGKIAGFIYFVFGIVAAVIMLIVGVGASFRSPFATASMGILGALVLPLFYGVAGFVGGFIGALLYNFGAKYMGGIKIETK